MKPLTKAQLRDNAAAMIAFADGKPIQYNSSSSETPNWLDAEDLTDIEIVWHRPKPQPVSRPWSKPEDVPGPVCWIRSEKGQSERLVTMVASDGIRMFSLLGDHHTFFGWNSIAYYEHSTDRATWKPCTVEVAQ
jgi:hypothetical protein